MFFATERGEGFHIDSSLIPPDEQRLVGNRVFMFPDSVRLEDVWIVRVSKENYLARPIVYELAGEELFDHEPTKEDILTVMAKYDAVYFSYAEVIKAVKIPREG